MPRLACPAFCQTLQTRVEPCEDTHRAYHAHKRVRIHVTWAEGKRDEMKLAATKIKTLLCLGDSITYGYGVRRRAVWPSLVGERKGLRVVNAGISGDTTGGMLARLDKELKAHTPDAVLLMGGVNDILLEGTDLHARSNMFAMLQHVLAGNTKVLIGICIEVSEHVDASWLSLVSFDRLSSCSAVYADWLRRLGAAFNIPVVDFRADFHVAMQKDPHADWYVDGIHPSELGHQIMADTLEHILS